MKVNFLTDVESEISSLRIKLEYQLEPYEFKRIATPIVVNENYLTQFVGKYTFGGIDAGSVFIDDKHVLRMNFPGQQEYHLSPVDSNRFKLDELDGYFIQFHQENDVATHLVSQQPDGWFTANCDYFIKKEEKEQAFLKSAEYTANPISLVNGGYENGVLFWSTPRGQLQSDVVHSGKYAYKISSDKPGWFGSMQWVDIPKTAVRMKVAGYIKADNIVLGKQEWEKARIAIEFQNKHDGMVGDYPPIVGHIDGTTDWTYYSEEYDIPKDKSIEKIRVFAGLGNCVGTAYFDDLLVDFFDTDGQLINK